MEEHWYYIAKGRVGSSAHDKVMDFLHFLEGNADLIKGEGNIQFSQDTFKFGQVKFRVYFDRAGYANLTISEPKDKKLSNEELLEAYRARKRKQK